MIQTAPFLLFLPFCLQALILFFDEFYYHHQRGLPKWEIFGHPMDTITAILPILYIKNLPYSSDSAFIFLILSVFSCLFITKDELIHKDVCSKQEMVLHALLFVLHPLLFISSFYFWQEGSIFIFNTHLTFKSFAFSQLLFMSSFLCYQITYWGFIYGKSHQQRNLS